MMFVYCLNPIDLWTGWLSEAEYKQQLLSNMDHDLHAVADAWDEYISFKSKAFELAKQIGWEGDIRHGETPDIAGLPSAGDGDGKVMLGWKQDNNGTTFVASPYPLPWLDRYAFNQTSG